MAAGNGKIVKYGHQNMKCPYFGRRDICVLCEEVVQSFFPTLPPQIPKLPSRFAQIERASEPEIGYWLAYVLYRTEIPDWICLFAVHLLHRLHNGDSTSTVTSFEDDTLMHHRLLLSSLILSTKYCQDNAYTNESWSIASKGLFTREEIDMMEMEVLEDLDYQLRLPGEDLSLVLDDYEKVWSEELEAAAKEELLLKKKSKWRL